MKPRAAEQDIPWAELEQIVHRDPAARGLASFRRNRAALDAGQLRAAAVHLSQHAAAVGIVTGFCIADGPRVAAETDGPPGALFLARAFSALGIEAILISDCLALPLLKAGCAAWNLTGVRFVEFPFEVGEPAAPARAGNKLEDSAVTESWLDAFFSAGAGRSLSHLIAIERPSPSHTLDSLAAQKRTGTVPTERFATLVPAADRDICHNMRGLAINAYTARTHRLFERIAEERLAITTIGIGDGGNEIGMGSFAWETIVEALGGDSASSIAGLVAARIATDFALIGGVSNWVAYALALALVRLRGDGDLARDWDERAERGLIEVLVRAGAVDGVTRRQEPTVDGLDLDTYLAPLAAMRSLLGIGDAAGH
jgi:hypothetical protein